MIRQEEGGDIDLRLRRNGINQLRRPGCPSPSYSELRTSFSDDSDPNNTGRVSLGWEREERRRD